MNVSEVNDVNVNDDLYNMYLLLGLKYCCNDENGLASANSRLIQVWKSCNSVMAYTSSAESCRQFQSELVSTLLDSIAQTTHRDKVCIIFVCFHVCGV